MKLGLLIAVIAVWPLLAGAQTFCYQAYQETRFNCYEYGDPVYGYMGLVQRLQATLLLRIR